MTQLNDILARLEASLGQRDGDPVPLSGGITNRNFRVRLGGRDYVLRVHGASTGLLGIDRESERLAGEAAAAAGIAPPVAAVSGGCLVTTFISCRAPAAGEVAARADEIARALRSFHGSGMRLPSTFWVPDLLERYEALLRERGITPPADLDAAAVAARRIERALPLERACPCHNDLLPGNIICAEQGELMLVDWEYAGMGHPYFDLGNLSVNNGFDAAADERMLGAYHGEPASEGRLAAVQLMRVLSDAREAAWGVLQAHISELEFAFDDYAATHFRRMHAALSSPDFEDWLAGAGA